MRAIIGSVSRVFIVTSMPTMVTLAPEHDAGSLRIAEEIRIRDRARDARYARMPDRAAKQDDAAKKPGDSGAFIRAWASRHRSDRHQRNFAGMRARHLDQQIGPPSIAGRRLGLGQGEAAKTVRTVDAAGGPGVGAG